MKLTASRVTRTLACAAMMASAFVPTVALADDGQQGANTDDTTTQQPNQSQDAYMPVENFDTMESVPGDTTVDTNYGDIGTNQGTVSTNFGGNVSVNEGTVGINLAGAVSNNKGIVEQNVGDVDVNEESGDVNYNGSGAILNVTPFTDDAGQAFVAVDTDLDGEADTFVNEATATQGKGWVDQGDETAYDWQLLDLPEEAFQAIGSDGYVKVNRGIVNNGEDGEIRWFDGRGDRIDAQWLHDLVSSNRYGVSGDLEMFHGGIVENNLETGVVTGGGRVVNNFAGSVADTVEVENDLRKVLFDLDSHASLKDATASTNDTYDEITDTKGTLWFRSGTDLSATLQLDDGYELSLVELLGLDGETLVDTALVWTPGGHIDVTGSVRNLLIRAITQQIQGDDDPYENQPGHERPSDDQPGDTKKDDGAKDDTGTDDQNHNQDDNTDGAGNNKPGIDTDRVSDKPADDVADTGDGTPGDTPTPTERPERTATDVNAGAETPQPGSRDGAITGRDAENATSTPHGTASHVPVAPVTGAALPTTGDMVVQTPVMIATGIATLSLGGWMRLRRRHE